MTQIGLMMFPLFFAPILTSLAFYGGNQRKPTKNEYLNLIAGVGSSTFVVIMVFIMVSGAWFWVFQGDRWFVIALVLGPPIAAAIAFGVLFPLGIRVIAWRTKK
jgi:hypothetical protein